MTLSTLKTMNVQMGDLERVAEDQERARAGAGSGTRGERARPQRDGEEEGRADPARSGGRPDAGWGALTNQFAQLATSAMKDTATDATKSSPAAC